MHFSSADVKPSRPVFLLTDFGAEGYHQGIMKAVLLGLAPELRVEDLGHGVPPGSVVDGAFVLEAAWTYLPENAIVIAVVDPGVGSARRVFAARLSRRTALLPDNGLITGIWERDRTELWTVEHSVLSLPAPSKTFHGRDLFAPAAAALAKGAREEDLFPRAEEPILLPGWRALAEGDAVRGMVVHIDPFGNAATSIRQSDLGDEPQAWIVFMGESKLPIHQTYADVDRGELLAYIGSSGHLEIGVRDGRADLLCGLAAGAPVACHRREGSP